MSELEKPFSSIINQFLFLKKELQKIIIGQEEIIHKLLIGIITNGHILIEGVPGLGKTLLIKTLAKFCNVDFKRIQFVPDLMPADIIGFHIFNPQKNEFTFKKGPIFTNFLLADEINRAQPRTQSALLECMEERQVSSDEITYKLSEPFIVFATQNPIEHEGVFPLSEAQIDRFLFKLVIKYPNFDSEFIILKKFLNNLDDNDFNNKSILNGNDILNIRKSLNSIKVSNDILKYILRIAKKTRNHPDIKLGMSTRSLIHILKASQACALLSQRTYVIPQDIKYIIFDILRHRLILNPLSALDKSVEMVIEEILDETTPYNE
ncbi:MAG: AAA family ATPase [Candidatus Helarchaeota archaeon]